ncbi:MAG: DNA-3-methyladenine glycosylase 2 family protein, partial [Gemmatimonadales bacterium]
MAAPAHAVSLARTDGLTYDPDLACSHLIQADPRLGALMIRAGPFTMRPRPTQSLFSALMRSIVYQQLTGKAAETILGRVIRTCAPRRFPTPDDILRLPPERLREAGLSTAKTAAVRDLAAKT